jgi:hypothetical protein
MSKRLAILLLLCVLKIADTRAQGNSQEYSRLVKQLSGSKAFADWIRTKRTGGPDASPAILRDAGFHLPERGDTARAKRMGKVFGKGSPQSKLFSASEQGEIVTGLFSNKPLVYWTNDLIPNAVFIDGSVDSLFNISGRYANGVYFISRPVFLRENSLAIVNYVWLRGSGGHTAYKIFRIENGQWYASDEFGGGDW